ncbi:MAG TPA: MBL fold metallo-hydrolase [Bosea sp. (in: a-proteobacteria)]|uniref:MBL fold metallo-hydrolase n=1 Tax=Bosea sp. (in: a-proteobacteria) TaxID=1871050 RepID=UPI002E136629|nr:MBL fold metallo-hydrolase [Bosea sp. (in: a-proteobacteria)]
MNETTGLLGCTFGIRFWGARGSIPVSGRSYDRFGGDTTCFEVLIAGHRIIVDAGSGLRRLGRAMAGAGESDATILFSHLHLDHVIGLTAFTPLWGMSGKTTMHVPAPEGVDPAVHFSTLLSEPFFPVGLHQAPGKVAVLRFLPGSSFSLSGLDIATVALQFDDRAAGFRFRHAGRTIVILTDYEHGPDDPDPRIVSFCRGADLIVYDAMWDEAIDYQRHRGWGHSTWQAGLRLLQAAGARRLACLHHPPSLTDVAIEAREADLKRCHSESFFARQDDVLVLIA